LKSIIEPTCADFSEDGESRLSSCLKRINSTAESKCKPDKTKKCTSKKVVGCGLLKSGINHDAPHDSWVCNWSTSLSSPKPKFFPARNPRRAILKSQVHVWAVLVNGGAAKKPPARSAFLNIGQP
jgi:hypothetical protein